MAKKGRFNSTLLKKTRVGGQVGGGMGERGEGEEEYTSCGEH